MPRTLGFHIVKSGHGLWLPGDDRGHWSSAWDAQIGYIEPHTLHDGDPVRKRMAQERMVHPPVRFTVELLRVMVETIARCAADSTWDIVAASFEPTHLHLLMTWHPRSIDKTCKWLAQQMSKAMHEQTGHIGPVFAKSKWCSFIYDLKVWDNTEHYIDRHNEQRGLAAKPYDFLRA
jgi:REP element-mobilizing transposase RayT